jgi:multiple sugar transport system permease protein
MRRLNATRSLSKVTILVVIVVFLAPPIWMTMTAFKAPRDITSWPPRFAYHPTLENWLWFFHSSRENAMAPEQGRKILFTDLPNSVIVSLVTTLLSVSVSCLCAYGLARIRFRGRRSIGVIILGTRMLPPIAIAIPLFIIMNYMGLRDTLSGLAISYTALSIPLAVWILWGFIREIPEELDEAALIDGCSKFGVLTRIILPLAKPGIATAGIFSYLVAWNDLPIALFLVSHRAETLPLAAMGFYSEEGVFWGPMSAFGLVYLIPTVLFALGAQRYIVKGLTMGAIK